MLPSAIELQAHNLTMTMSPETCCQEPCQIVNSNVAVSIHDYSKQLQQVVSADQAIIAEASKEADLQASEARKTMQCPLA